MDALEAQETPADKGYGWTAAQGLCKMREPQGHAENLRPDGSQRARLDGCGTTL